MSETVYPTKFMAGEIGAGSEQPATRCGGGIREASGRYRGKVGGTRSQR